MGSKNMYWGAREEEAVVAFNEEEDPNAKDKIFQAVIKPAFDQLAQNIFFTYNFHQTLPDSHWAQQEVVHHMFEKLDRFQAGRAKAFSYFGTVAKNWFLQQAAKAKRSVRIDEDEREHIGQKISVGTYSEEQHNTQMKDILEALSDSIGNLSLYDTVLTKDDESVIAIVQEILKNRARIDIYNKKQLYVYVREATGLPARKVTQTLIKVRRAYGKVKHEFLNPSFIGVEEEA